MIAYDLDGVLCPEYTYLDNVDTETVLRMTMILMPMFQPTQDYFIITGRTNADITQQWITARLHKKPLNLFVNTSGLNPAQYKANVINEHKQITTFIESDINQVKILKELTTIEIVWINNILSEH